MRDSVLAGFFVFKSFLRDGQNWASALVYNLITARLKSALNNKLAFSYRLSPLKITPQQCGVFLFPVFDIEVI